MPEMDEKKGYPWLANAITGNEMAILADWKRQ